MCKQCKRKHNMGTGNTDTLEEFLIEEGVEVDMPNVYPDFTPFVKPNLDRSSECNHSVTLNLYELIPNFSCIKCKKKLKPKGWEIDE